MQQMRLGNARSKSEFDVGSSAGVGCGVDSRRWLGGAAAGTGVESKEGSKLKEKAQKVAAASGGAAARLG